MASRFFRKSIFIPATSLSLLLVGCQTTLTVCNIYSAFQNNNEEKNVPTRFLDISNDHEIIYGFKSDISNDQIFDGKYTSLIIPKGIKYIAPHAFANMFDGLSNGINKIVLPDTVTEIGDCAFENDTATEINVFDIQTLVKIGTSAFRNCNKLSGEWTTPPSLLNIGNSCFANCKEITGIKLSKKIQSIGSGAFAGCENLSNIDLKDYDEIPNWCFNSESIFKLAGTASVGNKTVKYVTNITTEDVWQKNLFEKQQISDEFSKEPSLVFPEDKITLDGNVIVFDATAEEFEKYDILKISKSGYFYDRSFPNGWQPSKPKSIIFTAPCNLVSGFSRNQPWILSVDGMENFLEQPNPLISQNAFNKQSLLYKDMQTPFTTISNNAFDGCSSFYRLDFIRKANLVGPNAFSNTTNLSQINLKVWGSDLVGWSKQTTNKQFSNTSWTGVVLGKQEVVSDFFSQYFQLPISESQIPNNWIGLDLIADHEKNNDDAINIHDGKVYGFNTDTETPITTFWSLNIPSDATSIVNGAFAEYFNGDIKRPEGDQYWLLYLPDNLTRIGDNAFKNCSSLNGALQLPRHLEYIGDNAFLNGSFHSHFALPKYVKHVGDNAFAKCRTLSSSNFVIPDATEHIGDNAFDCIPIKKITFGSGLQYLGNHFSSHNTLLDTIDMGLLSVGDVPNITWGYACFDLAPVQSGEIIIHNKTYQSNWTNFFKEHGDPVASGWKLKFVDN